MVRWRCKDWLLYVDLEGTKEYYRNFQLDLNEEQKQIWENYKVYCECLSDTERRFFDSFGITPQCCNVSSFGVNKKGTLCVWGTYKIKGTYEHIMEEVAIPVEEFVEKKMYLPQNQSKFHNGLHIGSYGITFAYPGSQFNPCPEDLEDGWIQFEFWLEEIPWLLETPCTFKEYEPPHWWQLKKRYDEHIEAKQLQQTLRNECIDSVETYFREQKIRFVRVEDEKIEPLKRYWLKRFTPEGKEDEAKKVCLSSKKTQNFLWHLFSYEIVSACEGADANRGFETLRTPSYEVFTEQGTQWHYNHMKQKAWVFFQMESIGWKIDCASKIDPLELRKVVKDFFADFYITASDFSWTYAHTHEECCGPYWYDRCPKRISHVSSYEEDMIHENDKFIMEDQ